MKKLGLVLISTLLLAALLASCQTGGNNTDNPDINASSIPSHPAASQKPPVVDDSSLADSTSSGGESTSSEDPTIEKSVTGILDDIALGKLYLLLDDGMTLVFEYTEADLSKFTNSLPGSRITIYYTGKINGSNTSAAKVTRIENVD